MRSDIEKNGQAMSWIRLWNLAPVFISPAGHGCAIGLARRSQANSEAGFAAQAVSATAKFE